MPYGHHDVIKDTLNNRSRSVHGDRKKCYYNLLVFFAFRELREMKQRLIDFGHAVYRFLPSAGGFLANLSICAMVILVLVIAALRYGFGFSPRWGDSFCTFLIVFCVFLGAGHTFVSGKHVRITFLISKVPPRIQTLVEAVNGVIAIFFIGYLIYSTGELALMSFELHSRDFTGMFLFPLQIWLPIGMMLLLVPLVGFTIVRIRRILKGKD